MVWRRQWESSCNPDLKERLLTYNRDDCAALKVVTDFIHGLAEQCQQTDGDRELVAGTVAVSRIPDLKAAIYPTEFGVSLSLPGQILIILIDVHILSIEREDICSHEQERGETKHKE